MERKKTFSPKILFKRWKVLQSLTKENRKNLNFSWLFENQIFEANNERIDDLNERDNSKRMKRGFLQVTDSKYEDS